MVYGTYTHVLPSPASALYAIKPTAFIPSTRDYRRIMKRRAANNIPTSKNQYINTQARPRHVTCTRRRTYPPLATPYTTDTPLQRTHTTLGEYYSYL